MRLLVAFVVFLCLVGCAYALKSVSVTAEPKFSNSYMIVTTDGDKVQYGITLKNNGTEPIDGKFWYDLKNPDQIGYNLTPVNIENLTPGQAITIPTVPFFISEFGAYTLCFGINQNGIPDYKNTALVNGQSNTLNLVQHSFNALDRNWVVAPIITGIILLIIGIILKVR